MRKSKKTKRVKCQVIPELTPRDRTIAEYYEFGMTKKALLYSFKIKESQLKNTLNSPAVKAYLKKIRVENRQRCHKMMDRMARMLERRLKEGKVTETKTKYKYDKKGRTIETISKKTEHFTPRDLAEMAKLAGIYTPNISLTQTINNTSNEVVIGEELIQQVKLLKGA